MTTDTPRTDAEWASTWQTERRLHELCLQLERELSEEIANRKKCCRDGNAISDELFDTQLKLKASQAEVEKIKTEYWFTEEAMTKEIAAHKQDVSKGLELADEWANKCVQAEAEVERLQSQLKRAVEIAKDSVDLANLDYENDKFGKVSELKQDLAKLMEELK